MAKKDNKHSKLTINDRMLIQACIAKGESADKGNIIFNNLGKITFTSFGYSSLSNSSFPFIL